jgi:TPP-dependent pyruvate/acetoin dehydrogenase alpha subunit
MQVVANKSNELTKEEFIAQVLNDYKIAFQSRQASLIGRKEVLTGKAKFGIFGDGKEVAQIAMAKVFEHGDWRSGYYRDQTFMFAKGLSDVQKFFAQLYAHTNVEKEPASGGRSMNGHYATRFLDETGNWLSQTEKVIKEFRHTHFFRVTEPGAFIPDKLGPTLTNLSHITYDEFSRSFPDTIYSDQINQKTTI